MLKLKVISPERVVFNGEVEKVVVPGSLGEFEILDSHAPIISTLKKGTVGYLPTGSGESVSLNIVSGFVEVQKNQVSLCVEL